MAARKAMRAFLPLLLALPWLVGRPALAGEATEAWRDFRRIVSFKPSAVSADETQAGLHREGCFGFWLGIDAPDIPARQMYAGEFCAGENLQRFRRTLLERGGVVTVDAEGIGSEAPLVFGDPRKAPPGPYLVGHLRLSTVAEDAEWPAKIQGEPAVKLFRFKPVEIRRVDLRLHRHCIVPVFRVEDARLPAAYVVTERLCDVDISRLEHALAVDDGHVSVEASALRPAGDAGERLGETQGGLLGERLHASTAPGGDERFWAGQGIQGMVIVGKLRLPSAR